MKQTSIILLAVLCFVLTCSSQKNVQVLQPVRLSIFKNGTYFIKKSAPVDLSDKAFTIKAPVNTLMGSYWLATGKETTIQSIVIKQDTSRVLHICTSVDDYLKASINKQITLLRSYSTTDKLTGLLLDFNADSHLIKVKTQDNKIVIASSTNFNEFAIAEDIKNNFLADSIAPLSTINVQSSAASTIASSLSLEKGIQWYPSYLFTIINDKEAVLQMKATIINGNENFYNTDVDIIIGNPEMFYGTELDPVCVRFLNVDIFPVSDNNQLNYSFANNLSTNGAYSTFSTEAARADTDAADKTGDKLEDLFVYKLGKVNLEKQASVIVPVMSTTVRYEDIYTVDIPVSGTTDAIDAEVHHKYKVTNNTEAPFTTGSVLVINQNELPIAQSQLKYTPVKGAQEINISKAIDVPAKSEETVVKTEKTIKRNNNNGFYDKTTYNGVIALQNLQNKKVKIIVKKAVYGFVAEASLKGKIRMIKDSNNSVNPTSITEWEIELDPGQKMELTYVYSALEN